MKWTNLAHAAWGAALLAGCQADVIGPNRPPVAVAGMDVVAFVGEVVALDGSGSFDPEGESLTFRWELLARPDGSASAISGAEQAQAGLTPDRRGVYLVSLAVSDGQKTSPIDTLRVSANSNVCTDDGDCVDTNACTENRCVDQYCTFPAVSDGTACGSDDWCTLGKTCQAGVCQGGMARDCTPLDDDCNQGVCDRAQRICTKQPRPDATLCDDGLFCTEADACQGGTCLGTARVCAPDDDCHEGVCNEATDQCDQVARPNNTSCTQNPVCTMNGVCAGGVCTGEPTDADGDGYGPRDCGGLDCDDARQDVNPGVFEGGFGSAVCGDGLDNDCDDQTDSGDSLCLPCQGPDDCADANLCNGSEQCVNGNCITGEPTDCDDLNPCTSDSCDPAQGCLHPPNSLPCEDGFFCTGNDTCAGGVCTGGPSPCATACQTLCNEAAGTCQDSPGTACQADAFACTLDQCDSAGTCAHAPDDAVCAGQQCRPTCFPFGTGCGSPPGALSLTCPASADPVVDPPPTCTVDLGSSGLGGCLGCSGSVLPLLVDLADFGEDDGACSLDGWTLVPGNLCLEEPAAGCADSGTRTACCADFATICQGAGGRFALVSNQATNCGNGNMEEWRIQKTFDTRGLHDLELCLDVVGSSADTSEMISIMAESPGVSKAVVLCRVGVNWMDGMRLTLCGALPSQFANRAAVTLTVVAHSSNPGEMVAVDRAMLKGWSDVCPRQIATALTETFATCPSTPGSGWSVSASQQFALNCGIPAWTCYDSSSLIYVSNGDVALERTISTLDLDADLRLCFSYGDRSSTGDDSITVQVDAGLGPVTVYTHTGNTAYDDPGCTRHCLHLSEVVPGIARNPSVKLHFALHSNGGTRLYLDQIELTGGKACPAGAALGLSSPTDTGTGTYTFEADPNGKQLASEITCQWGTEADNLQDSAEIDFVHRFVGWTQRR